MNLAQRLLRADILSAEQLAPALYRQKKYRGFLAKHLLDLNLVDPGVLAQFVQAYPSVPQSIEETGLPRNLLLQLLLKHSFYHDSITVREMAHEMKIPKHMVQEFIDYLKG